MQMKQLLTFQVVAEELNFSRAAIKLNYSQPTVSKHIQSLEEDLNVVLLTRKDGQYQLTEAGLQLYNHSLNIKKEVDAISQLSMLGGEASELTLQSHSYYGYKYFMPAIIKMRGTYPGINFVLHTSNNQETIKLLLKNIIDVGIVSGNLSGSVLPNTFEFTQIGSEEVGICVGKDIYRPGVTTEEYIQKYPVLIDESDYYRTSNIFPYFNQAIDIVDTNSDEVIHQALLRHPCVGVVRLGRLEENIKEGDIKVVETVIKKDPIYLAVNKDNMNQAHIQAFYEILLKTANPRSHYPFSWR